ncbi:MAG: putative murein hydrolase (TIGR00659 family) [Paraglaciecola sp.]|jgi:predicted murein hydrolase (TIGR00659 family)
MSSDDQLAAIWVYLSATPLIGLTLTLVVYSVIYKMYIRSHSNPLLNPVLLSIIVIIGVLLITNTSYQTYFDGAQYIHFLLGPATVALAVPLFEQLPKLKRLWLPVLVSIVGGVFIGVTSAVLIARGLGVSLEIQLSIAPKSVTAPVAMGISEQIGGLPSLTAAFVVITGILGALLGIHILKFVGIKDDAVKGIAIGVSSHGIGTARAFQESQEMGAFSGLGMALAALTTAVILPWIIQWLF